MKLHLKKSQLNLLENKTHPLRKGARPISIREFNHLVLKSRFPVLRKQHALIKSILRETETRFGIRCKSIAIMPDHCHILIQAPSRTLFQNALRFLCGMIALKMGRRKLWRERFWSRVVRRGRDFQGVANYIQQNPIRAGIHDLAVDAISVGGDPSCGSITADSKRAEVERNSLIFEMQFY